MDMPKTAQKTKVAHMEMDTEKWLLYPVCGNKARVKISSDMMLENFPLSYVREQEFIR